MFNTVKRNINPPTVISLIALFVAMGGTAWAIGKGSVKSWHIAKGAVKSRHITKGAVKSKQIANQSITGEEIAKASIGGGKLANGAIGGLQLASSSVDSGEIRDGSIEGKDIDKKTIDADNIKTSTITGSKIKNGSITSSDVKSNTFESAGDRLSNTVTERSDSFTVVAAGTGDKTASCQSDEKATGGGWSGLTAGNTVTESGLSGNGWKIAVTNASASDDVIAVKVICAKVS